jgi:hypothetical protein
MFYWMTCKASIGGNDSQHKKSFFFLKSSGNLNQLFFYIAENWQVMWRFWIHVGEVTYPIVDSNQCFEFLILQ